MFNFNTNFDSRLLLFFRSEQQTLLSKTKTKDQLSKSYSSEALTPLDSVSSCRTMAGPSRPTRNISVKPPQVLTDSGPIKKKKVNQRQKDKASFSMLQEVLKKEKQDRDKSKNNSLQGFLSSLWYTEVSEMLLKLLIYIVYPNSLFCLLFIVKNMKLFSNKAILSWGPLPITVDLSQKFCELAP